MGQDFNIGLLVGLPSRGKKVAFEWAMAFSGQNYPMNVNRMIAVMRNKPNGGIENRIDYKRNKIAEMAIQKKAKYVWFLDDDVGAPFFACRKLIYDLESADDDVMVAGGIYASKGTPNEPLVYKEFGVGAHWKWKKGEVFDCVGIGTGCMLIKTEVFTKIEPPWFKTVDEGPNGDSLGMNISDDLYFCQKVVEGGYRIIADGSVLCVHYDYNEDPPKAYFLPGEEWSVIPEKREGQLVV